MASTAGGFVFSTAPSRLLSSAIATTALREDSRREFIRTVEALPGSSILLVVEPTFAPVVSILLPDGPKQLAEHRIKKVTPLVFPLSENLEDYDLVLFFASPAPSVTREVIVIVNDIAQRCRRKFLHLINIPRRSFLSDSLLRASGVLAPATDTIGSIRIGEQREAFVTVSELQALDILPIDDDLCVLNMPRALADVANGDTSPLYATTKALMKIQAVYGPFRKIRSKGPMAGAIVDLMLRMRKESGKEHGEVNVSVAGDKTGEKSVGVAVGASALSGFHLDKASSDTRTFNASVTLHSSDKDDSASGGAPPPLIGEIDTCIILDRSVDFVTPLVSPLTFEALVDEIWGLDAGIAHVENTLVDDEDDDDGVGSVASKRTNNTASTLGTTELHLNSNSKLYLELRDCNFQAVGPKLQQKAKEIQNMRDSITKSRAADLSVADIRKFVKQIPGLQADMKMLKILINMTTLVQKHAHSEAFHTRWQLERSMIDEDNPKAAAEAITQGIAKGTDVVDTLRLMCLDSVLQGGLKAKQFDAVRRKLLHAKGFEIITALRTLESVGLLRRAEGTEGLAAAFSSSSSHWSHIRKSFCLTCENVGDVDDPPDIHYVTSGYAPLSVRLVQAALGLLSMAQPPAGEGGSAKSAASVVNGTWDYGQAAEVMKLLPGPVWNVVQTSLHGSGAMPGGGADGAAARPERKTVLLVFFGGVTYIELACLRFISERAPVDFLVLASCTINAEKLIGSVFQPLRSNLVRDPPSPPAETAAPTTTAAAPKGKK